MKIGVISDSHNNILALEKALAIFTAKKVDTVLHAGDIENVEHVGFFDKFKLYLAQGNCDDLYSLKLACKHYSQPEPAKYHELEFDNKKIFLFHGDDSMLYRNALGQGSFDYIIKGHSHFTEDYKKGRTRVLNPGALYRSAVYTLGILDLQNDLWEKIDIPKE
ncbi:MAG: YfcE family phosphodiesterase [Leptospirales bacterium]